MVPRDYVQNGVFTDTALGASEQVSRDVDAANALSQVRCACLLASPITYVCAPRQLLATIYHHRLLMDPTQRKVLLCEPVTATHRWKHALATALLRIAGVRGMVVSS